MYPLLTGPEPPLNYSFDNPSALTQPSRIGGWARRLAFECLFGSLDIRPTIIITIQPLSSLDYPHNMGRPNIKLFFKSRLKADEVAHQIETGIATNLIRWRSCFNASRLSRRLPKKTN